MKNLIRIFNKENFPNFLTCLRIILIPSIILFIMSDKPEHSWIALYLYIFACISDFFDGYMARRFNLETNFGKFLDPVADKILVVSIIYVMVVVEVIDGILVFPGLVIILRELLVSGLRDFFSHKDGNLIVTKLSKLKTLIQMSSLGFLIVHKNFETQFIFLCGFIGLSVAAILTIYTGYIYFKNNIKLF
tara:strand:- start:2162 stop:2731 length:570 start_codon:yes stop_codon:yes gene_type:complete